MVQMHRSGTFFPHEAPYLLILLVWNMDCSLELDFNDEKGRTECITIEKIR